MVINGDKCNHGILPKHLDIDRSVDESKSRKCGLLTKCEAKMAGYWPSSFFGVYFRTETKSRSMNSQKKERGKYPATLT